MKVEYITHSGNDMLVVNAARTSFGKQKELDAPLDDRDKGLIRFLARGVRDNEYKSLIQKACECNAPEEMENILKRFRKTPSHWAPFAHPHITLRETMPIFVARQRYKHMVGFVYSEESKRYMDNVPNHYTFHAIRQRPEGSIKQGSGGVHPNSPYILDTIADAIAESNGLYYALIREEVAPEQARAVLPQSMEITCVVTGSLYAFANAYVQRSDAHAQMEIQHLAKMWDEIIRPLFPESWKALVD